MSTYESYSHVSSPLLEQRKCQLEELYWNLIDQIAEVVMEKSVVMDVLKDRGHR